MSTVSDITPCPQCGGGVQAEQEFDTRTWRLWTFCQRCGFTDIHTPDDTPDHTTTPGVGVAVEHLTAGAIRTAALAAPPDLDDLRAQARHNPEAFTGLSALAFRVGPHYRTQHVLGHPGTPLEDHFSTHEIRTLRALFAPLGEEPHAATSTQLYLRRSQNQGSNSENQASDPLPGDLIYGYWRGSELTFTPQFAPYQRPALTLARDGTVRVHALLLGITCA